MRQRRYMIVTFGCQMNEHDSERIRGILESLGLESTEDAQEADLILFNTCSVRRKPERKVLNRLYELRSLKEERPDLIIGVCGCMVQREGERDHLWDSLPHVDLVFGTHNIHRLPELLERVESTRERVFEIWESPGEIVEGLPVTRQDGLKAWVNITIGCDNACAYCVVPHVRGGQRSRSPEAIEREVQELAAHGYREVTLLGQNVNSYGLDRGGSDRFSELLCRLNRIEGIERIRFMTSHPRDMSEEIAKSIAECAKVCEHVHLPVQAGSNRVLSAMRRGYTREGYLRIVNMLRSRIPGVSVTTDLIVGFPGERGEDFDETLSLVQKVRFDAAFTFVYSPREGTVAFDMEDSTPRGLKTERLQRLIDVQKGITEEKNRDLVGTVQEVLIEGTGSRDPSEIWGRTRTDRVVILKGDQARRGEIVRTTITESSTWALFGERIETDRR